LPGIVLILISAIPGSISESLRLSEGKAAFASMSRTGMDNLLKLHSHWLCSLAILFGSVSAFWKTGCRTRLLRGRVSAFG
jgi:hypothetical protein